MENIESTNYLNPLQGFTSTYPLESLKDFVSEHPLEIFTLNYDGVIDLFCESCGIDYSDGFRPFWDPMAFDSEKISMKILDCMVLFTGLRHHMAK